MLLFPAGGRPTADAVAQLLASTEAGIRARVSHRPDPEEGWLELLTTGLTFDLRGLAPAASAESEAVRHAYGFDGPSPDGASLEAIELVASGHVAAGAGLPPVVRAMAGLAANLVLHLSASAVVWQPAQTLMEPRYFSRIILNWLSGGAFPALGLTALVPGDDGSVATVGLSHFIGQEMQLEGREGEPQADAVKLAIRLVDHLVRGGPPTGPVTIELQEGALLAEPSRAGKRVWIWRKEA